MAGLKTLVKCEVAGYNEMMTNARELATQRMIKEAEALGQMPLWGYGTPPMPSWKMPRKFWPMGQR